IEHTDQAMTLRISILVFITCVFCEMGQIRTVFAQASDEPTLIQLFHTDYKFSSGFRWRPGCEFFLMDQKTLLRPELAAPIDDFESLSISGKILNIHKIADLIYRITVAEARSHSLDFQSLKQSAIPLGQRLNILVESSPKKLSPYSRDLLVINHK